MVNSFSFFFTISNLAYFHISNYIFRITATDLHSLFLMSLLSFYYQLKSHCCHFNFTFLFHVFTLCAILFTVPPFTEKAIRSSASTPIQSRKSARDIEARLVHEIIEPVHHVRQLNSATNPDGKVSAMFCA